MTPQNEDRAKREAGESARELVRTQRDVNEQLVLSSLRAHEERDAADLHASVAETRFQLLVDSVKDYAIFVLDPAGIVSTWNAGAKRCKGYDAGEIIGRHFSIFYPQEEVEAGKCDQEIEIAAREGRSESEGWHLRKEGSLFWANTVLTALHDPQTGALVGFARVTRDLTEQRRAEEERFRLAIEGARRESAETALAAQNEARCQAEAANRLKDEFLATMSHELRTPLNAILGWSSLLRRGPRDDKSIDRALATIERNAKTQARLIEDILDVSRIITGKLSLEMRHVDVNAIARAAVDVVRPAAEAKRVHLIIDLAPVEVVERLIGDADRLQQVVWNLLSNAVKFTPPGGTVSLHVERTGSTERVTVQDTGAGIAPEHLPVIFERFRQVDSSTTRRFTGLGLGLAIVRHLVEMHGGSVTADSGGAGFGSTFTVTLPIRAVYDAKAEAEADAEVKAEADVGADAGLPNTMSQSPRTLSGVFILVVDDDEDSRQLIESALERLGASVKVVGSARAAIAFIENNQVDVMISDIGMPDEDGFALMKRVRALPASRGGQVPAIALTAYARAEDATRAHQVGFQRHLAKPADVDLLTRSVAELVSH